MKFIICSNEVMCFICTYVIFALTQMCNAYVFDEDYPIVLTSNQKTTTEINEEHNYNTDHFGFSLDLAKYSTSTWLWVGAPKGISYENGGNIISGTLNACNLNSENPFCEGRQASVGNSNVNDNFTDQLFGITVNTVRKSSSQKPQVRR